ncbi:MAG: hypothetical protein K2L87_00030 [Clostridiales bacterium]|nr:hypothetical protein [Clostridiales bacterium]
MIESIKELKRQLDARAKQDEIERDDEGRAVIEMSVLKDEDFLSDFSSGKAPTVSGEVAEFLNESAMAFLPKEQLHIKIYSDCIDSEEEKSYKTALREYYVRHYKRNRQELRRNAIVSAIMFLIGIAALSIGVTFTFFGRHEVWGEILDIFAWVFIWEAVDLFFLERSVLRMGRMRCLSFIAAKISYYPRSQEKEEQLPEMIEE